MITDNSDHASIAITAVTYSWLAVEETSLFVLKEDQPAFS